MRALVLLPGTLFLASVACSGAAPPGPIPPPPKKSADGLRRPEPRAGVPPVPADWIAMEDAAQGFGVKVPPGTERVPSAPILQQALPSPLAGHLPKDVFFYVATFRGKSYLPDDLENMAKTIVGLAGGENPKLDGCDADRAGFTICQIEVDDVYGGRKGCAIIGSDGVDQYVLVATAARGKDDGHALARTVCGSLYLF